VIPSLAALQDALAQVVTSDDRAAIPETLAGLSETDLRRYARGLRQKHWAEVAATVPLSTRVIPQLKARYEAWLRAHPPQTRDTVLSPGAAEALRALPVLADGLAGDPEQAPYAAELLAFEVLAACSRADGTPRTLRARYAIHAIVTELGAGLIPVDPPLDGHVYRFERGGPRHRRVP
jgi:hypothetical protein